MKWFLIVIMTSHYSGWSAGTDKQEFAMPDKEACIEAQKQTLVANNPNANTAIIVLCAQK